MLLFCKRTLNRKCRTFLTHNFSYAQCVNSCYVLKYYKISQVYPLLVAFIRHCELLIKKTRQGHQGFLIYKQFHFKVFGEPLSLKQPPLLTSNKWSATTHNYSAEEGAFTERIIAFWSNFVKRNNPNGPGLVAWTKFNSDSSSRINSSNGGGSFRFLSNQQEDSSLNSILSLNRSI